MRVFRIIALAGLGVFLTACATAPQMSATRGEEPEQHFAQGNYLAAAEGFARLMESASGETRQQLQLRYIAALARGEQLAQAKQRFATVAPLSGDSTLALLYRLTQAHIAIAERQANLVLEILKPGVAPQAREDLHAEYHDLRALAYTLLGNRIETARELVQRETYLRDPALISANQRDIWQALASLTERALQQLRTAPPPDTLSGWMHLIEIAKVNQQRPLILKQQLQLWRQMYVNHPVQEQFLAGLMDRREEDVAYPDNIALLLPLTGKFNHPAQAIRDGFLAAYYSQTQKREQKIRIYDVSESPENIHQVYQNAVADGAEMIIGPLNKDAVTQLAQLEQIPVPTLTLNYLSEESQAPAKLFQFGLSPEDETIQVTERTWLDGHVKAAVLVPSGPWGERIFSVFKQRWEHMGGEVVEMQTYDATRNDFSRPIKMLLDIDASEQRRRLLRSVSKSSSVFFSDS
ncbi:MAG: penicillin-binding protein activator [Gammaproteobacteria bacterium]